MIRAYAASAGSANTAVQYGSQEAEVIVRRAVSLTPSVPRVVRIGDAFQAGVVVTAPDITGPMTVKVSATMAGSNGSLKMRGDSSQSITLTPAEQQQEVGWQGAQVHALACTLWHGVVGRNPCLPLGGNSHASQLSASCWLKPQRHAVPTRPHPLSPLLLRITTGALCL